MTRIIRPTFQARFRLLKCVLRAHMHARDNAGELVPGIGAEFIGP